MNKKGEKFKVILKNEFFKLGTIVTWEDEDELSNFPWFKGVDVDGNDERWALLLNVVEPCIEEISETNKEILEGIEEEEIEEIQETIEEDIWDVRVERPEVPEKVNRRFCNKESITFDSEYPVGKVIKYRYSHQFFYSKIKKIIPSIRSRDGEFYIDIKYISEDKRELDEESIVETYS